MQNEQLVCMAMGYLAGSFLTAVFVARTFTEKEISQIGTGNPGMANVMANIGKKEGAKGWALWLNTDTVNFPVLWIISCV